MVPIWLQAGLWGGMAGGALLIGAAVAYWVHVPLRLIAGMMAFGSGVLISALAFELMDEAYQRGGFDEAIGFLGGAVGIPPPTGSSRIVAPSTASAREGNSRPRPGERQRPGDCHRGVTGRHSGVDCDRPRSARGGSGELRGRDRGFSLEHSRGLVERRGDEKAGRSAG